MPFKRTTVVALAFLWLAAPGCRTAAPPATERLVVDVPPAWTSRAGGEEDLSAEGWLADFGDAALVALVVEALRHNHDLSAAAARLEAARATVTVAGADRLPQGTGGLQASRQKRSSSGGVVLASDVSDEYALAFDVSWEIDLWGRVADRRNAALADWEGARETYRGARLSLAGQTAQAWFSALEAELQQQLAAQTLDSFAANLSVVESRYRSGLSGALDLRLTRANVAAARGALQARRLTRDAAVRALEILVGRYPAGAVELVDRLPAAPAAAPAGLPSDLLMRRPDLLVAERRLRAAGRRSSEARKALLPTIRMTGGAGGRSSELEQVTDLNVWNLAAGLTQPIFQGRRLQGNVTVAEAREDEALADFRQAALRAFREVETALVGEEVLAEQEDALRTTADESAAAEQLAWDQYGEGLTDIVTVLESQRRSVSAKRQLLALRRERLRNRVALYLALGGSFDGNLEPDPGTPQ